MFYINRIPVVNYLNCRILCRLGKSIKGMPMHLNEIGKVPCVEMSLANYLNWESN